MGHRASRSRAPAGPPPPSTAVALPQAKDTLWRAPPHPGPPSTLGWRLTGTVITGPERTAVLFLPLRTDVLGASEQDKMCCRM